LLCMDMDRAVTATRMGLAFGGKAYLNYKKFVKLLSRASVHALRLPLCYQHAPTTNHSTGNPTRDHVMEACRGHDDLLVSGSSDGNVVVWSMARAEYLRTFSGHSGVCRTFFISNRFRRHISKIRITV
jgi:hypothetical protein